MEEEQRREDVLQMKYVRHSSVDSITLIVDNLRRLIDVYYPRLSPAQRIGHYFAKDIQSIVGYLHQALQRDEDKVNELNKADDNWTKYFKFGTPLELTPFQVEEMIETRERQIHDMMIELHKLRRRIQRLRLQSVKLYPDEVDEMDL